MLKFAANNWMPVDITLPPHNKIVILQTEELPDPTFGLYNHKKGKWIITEKDFEDAKLNVKAWREMPEPFKEEEEKFIFRTAEEAFQLSYLSLKRIKRGNPEGEFFSIREKILSQCSSGKFSLECPDVSEVNIKRLINAGFKVEKKDGLIIINWNLE